MTVTATRTERLPHDVPGSISRIDGETLRDARLGVQIADVLQGVPGLVARDRQNHAQDVQISVRGFGSRASFGIRGVRLYVDGIPATLPDGQGQITHADLASAERIEVLRGPISALYGNASGGVVLIETEEGSGPPRLRADLGGGRDATWRAGVKASGGTPALGWVASASRFETDGYREHSGARRDLANAKLVWRPDPDTKLAWTLNRLDLPLAQDPLGLTRADFAANPRGVDPGAIAFDTRKSVDQTQTGLVAERRLSPAHSVRAVVYAGERGTEQFLAIPTGPQAAPTHPGGVIGLERRYHGIDLRWSMRGDLLDRPATLIAGYAYDALSETRQGFLNFVTGAAGEPHLGVRGALRRDEKNRVTSRDPYLQAAWEVAPRWSVEAGVRRSVVRFESADRHVAAANPDDSGGGRHSATLPVAALRFDATPDLALYATAGRGFETPTLNETAYRPGGETGPNLGLRPAKSRSVEIGLKARHHRLGAATLALFETRTTDEIVTLASVGGRATFQNAGSTRRRGVEAGWQARLGTGWRAEAALAFLDARYRDDFAVCDGTPCTVPATPVEAGRHLPGLARRTAYVAVAWAPERGLRYGVEARASSRVWADDRNTDAAPGYATLGAHVGWRGRTGPVDWDTWLRIDNALDRRYAGSVIVNEGNGRYFEPATGRSIGAGVAASISF